MKLTEVNSLVTLGVATDKRKSSCVNARRIPTAAYQVLHPRWRGSDGEGGGTRGGVPPSRGYPQPGPTGGYPRWGTPWQGWPPGQVWWGVPKVVPPWPGPRGAWGGYPPARSDGGLPDRGTPPRCGQTEWWTDTCQNITFPSYYVRGR